MQIAHRPLLAAAGELENIDEETFAKLVIAEQDFGFEEQLTAMEHIKDTLKTENRDPNSRYMSRNFHLKKILTRSQICVIGSRYTFRQFAVEIDQRQVERIWRKLGTI